MDSRGTQKIRDFCSVIRKWHPDMCWLWIDTCCIDKASSAELSEAINSMFRWYRKAAYCLAYLEDVTAFEPDTAVTHFLDLAHSVWFTRGWTLQELLAPKTVIFFSQNMGIIGRKGPMPDGVRLPTLRDLTKELSYVTKIPEVVLKDFKQSRDLAVEQKLAWMSNRITTRVEDMAYCLLGILDVSMPVIYGEGSKAYTRLLKELDEKPKEVVPPRKRKRPAEGLNIWSAVPSDLQAITKQGYLELMLLLDDNTSVASSSVPEQQPSLLKQVLKLYLRMQPELPNTERYRNLTWRMLSMSTRRVRVKSSGVDEAVKTSVLRHTFFPSWKNNFDSLKVESQDDIEDLESLYQDDLMALQAWKFYHKCVYPVPNAERMENLTWRMMNFNPRV